jgi:DNA-binding SARP family transcriptional activator
MSGVSESLLRQAEGVSQTSRLTLLGALELTGGDGPISLPLPAQRLVAFLALHDQPMTRAYIACTLWIDSSEDRAFGSLRSALWRLRREGHHVVEAAHGRLRLAPEVVVDIRETAGAARRVLDSTSELVNDDREQLVRAGDLLPDWYDEWVVLERERFRQLRVHALEGLCERLAAAGRLAEAVEIGLTAVKAEPLRESAHRALIRAYLAEGNYADALRQHRFFSSLVGDRLGLEPSEELNALMMSSLVQ